FLALVVEMQQQGVFSTHWQKITRRAAAVAAQKFTPRLQNGTRSAVRPEACHVASATSSSELHEQMRHTIRRPQRVAAGAHAGLAGELEIGRIVGVDAVERLAPAHRLAELPEQ